jgi:hypothetical protein
MAEGGEDAAERDKQQNDKPAIHPSSASRKTSGAGTTAGANLWPRYAAVMIATHARNEATAVFL